MQTVRLSRGHPPRRLHRHPFDRFISHHFHHFAEIICASPNPAAQIHYPPTLGLLEVDLQSEDARLQVVSVAQNIGLAPRIANEGRPNDYDARRLPVQPDLPINPCILCRTVWRRKINYVLTFLLHPWSTCNFLLSVVTH